ncbi:citrate synthase [Caballeronia arvi]|uniref:Citrate synthase n=1 Tax=Caballeronia arvi TaxID=1777135 RepID=A0A158J4P7_9BURK|nr:citrate synthase [Caballeronia arvi]
MRTDHDPPAPDAARPRAARDESKIDAVSISPDRLAVRGVDLLQLIDSVDFVAAILHVLTGRMPDAGQMRALDRALTARLADHATPDDDLLAAQRARRQVRPEVFLIAAVAASVGRRVVGNWAGWRGGDGSEHRRCVAAPAGRLVRDLCRPTSPAASPWRRTRFQRVGAGLSVRRQITRRTGEPVRRTAGSAARRLRPYRAGHRATALFGEHLRKRRRQAGGGDSRSRSAAPEGRRPQRSASHALFQAA